MKVSDKELKMAEALIDLLKDDFEPEKYKDEYREALMQVIDAKLEGEELSAPKAARPAKITDLMTALKASVEAAKKGSKPAANDQPTRVQRSSACVRSKNTRNVARNAAWMISAWNSPQAPPGSHIASPKVNGRVGATLCSRICARISSISLPGLRSVVLRSIFAFSA